MYFGSISVLKVQRFRQSTSSGMHLIMLSLIGKWSLITLTLYFFTAGLCHQALKSLWPSVHIPIMTKCVKIWLTH